MAVSDIVPQQPMVWHALAYAARGIPVFPCKPDKSPYTEHGWKNATTDTETIRAWWKRWPKALIAGPGGAISGYAIVDVDPRNGGTFDDLIARYPDLPITRTARTPSGGIHLWYKAPAGMPLPKDNSGKIAAGVDFIGDGAYAIFPPSQRPDGAYVWTDERECAELPASIIAAVQRPKPQPVTSGTTTARKRGKNARPSDSQPATGNGPGDAAAYWLAWALEQARDGTSDRVGFLLAQQLLLSRGNPDVDGTLRAYAAQASFDVHKPFTDRDISRWLTSAQASDLVRRGEPAQPRGQAARSRGALALVEMGSYYDQNYSNGDDEQPPTQPPTEPPDDSHLLKGEADDNGNAEAMYRLFGKGYLYTPAYGWLEWLGTHWQAIAEPIIAQKAIITLKRRRHAAVEASAEAIVKATKADKSRVVGAYTLFKSYVIERDVSRFDADPDLLNVRNGVLHLPTGQITPHDSGQRFTYCVGVDYDPAADKTAWETFVLDALGGDVEMARYFQLFAGYSLTGHTREEKMLYLYGPPRAGKGTITETLLALLPHPLSTEADFNTFTAKRDNDSQNFDLAELKPARLVVATESNKYQSLNPAKIKALTGGSMTRCAFKHKDMFTYKPQYKLWLVSNHKVNADADDDALWGRVQVFTFPHSHLGAEDVTLKARMRSPENLRGVLRWAVEGAMEWYRLGRLTPPDAVVSATQAQRDAQDYIRQWVNECCTLDAERFCLSAGLRSSYTAWCEAQGVKPITLNDFADALVKRFGCVPKRQAGTGLRGYTGIFLGVTPHPEDD